MTAQTKTMNDNVKRSPWHTLREWLAALDESLHYDPQEYANRMIQLLAKRVEQLETRVNELQKPHGEETAQ